MHSDDFFYIDSWQRAEEYAAAYLRALGFGDTWTTQGGADRGVDVVGRGVIGQVKFVGGKTGRPMIQRFVGASNHHPGWKVFFSGAGFSEQALIEGDVQEVALFSFDPVGNVYPQNRYADFMLDTLRTYPAYAGSQAPRELTFPEAAFDAARSTLRSIVTSAFSRDWWHNFLTWMHSSGYVLRSARWTAKLVYLMVAAAVVLAGAAWAPVLVDPVMAEGYALAIAIYAFFAHVVLRCLVRTGAFHNTVPLVRMAAIPIGFSGLLVVLVAALLVLLLGEFSAAIIFLVFLGSPPIFVSIAVQSYVRERSTPSSIADDASSEGEPGTF